MELRGKSNHSCGRASMRVVAAGSIRNRPPRRRVASAAAHGRAVRALRDSTSTIRLSPSFPAPCSPPTPNASRMRPLAGSSLRLIPRLAGMHSLADPASRIASGGVWPGQRSESCTLPSDGLGAAELGPGTPSASPFGLRNCCCGGDCGRWKHDPTPIVSLDIDRDVSLPTVLVPRHAFPVVAWRGSL